MFSSGGIRSMRMCLALALSAVIAIPALAQPPRGGGFGGGGSLLTNKSVQEELKVTEEQNTKIKEFTDKLRAEAPMRDPNADREEQAKKFQEYRKVSGEKTDKFVKETLTEEQQKRYKQIQIQQAGLLPGFRGMGGPSEDTLKALKVTDEQKTTFKEIGEQLGKDIG